MGEYSGNLNYNQIRWSAKEWQRIKAALRPRERMLGIHVMWISDEGGRHVRPRGGVRRWIYERDLGGLVYGSVALTLVTCVLALIIGGCILL